MLAIKLKRIGKKHQPSFRVVVAEKRSKLQGRFIEDLGWYNPRSKEFGFNKEGVEHWLKNGAQPTDSVYNLFVRAQIISGPKRPLHKKSKKKEEVPAPTEKAEKTEAVPEAPAETEAPPEIKEQKEEPKKESEENPA